MLKKFSIFFVVITGVILIINLIYFWMNATVDTDMFYEFAKFIRTGIYVYPMYNLGYKGVLTGSPPLFSVLLYVLDFFNRSDIWLHVIHLMMLVITTYLVYQILRKYFNQYYAIIISCIFSLIPGNLIYTTLVISDLGAQFLFMIYGYLFFMFIQTRKPQYVSLSVLVGFITGLMRYSFIIFGGFSLLFLIWLHPRALINYFFATIGIIVIFIWVIIQHSLTGEWGIACCGGVRYNIQMMMMAKVLPREDDPSMIEIRKYIPREVDLRKPHWELEQYILPHVNRSFVRSINIIGNVGKAAMWQHPFDFIRVSLYSFFYSHFNPPYAGTLATFGLGYAIDYPPLFCGAKGTMQYCKPIIMTPYSYQIWNAFVNTSNFFYRYIYPVYSFGIFFPSIIWVVFSRNNSLKLFGLLFMAGRIPIAMATWPDPRYVVPFYPLMIIIPCLAISEISSIIQRKILQNKLMISSS
jgi:hypothetical protein